MGYVMKGHSLPGIKQRPTQNLKDGRSISSPYQKTTSGSDQENDSKKKKDDTVVNSRTGKVSSVATERLKKAGAPPEVIKASEAKTVKNFKKKKARTPKTNQGDFVPAYPGADISKKEYEKRMKSGSTKRD